jgi:hypothetical protein
VEFGFDEIAELVGGLPASATQRQWSADTDHPRARAWLTANCRVDQVQLDRGRVRFSLGGLNADVLGFDDTSGGRSG